MTSILGATSLPSTVVPSVVPLSAYRPYIPMATHAQVTPMPPAIPTGYAPRAYYPSSYSSGAMPSHTSYPASTAYVPGPVPIPVPNVIPGVPPPAIPAHIGDLAAFAQTIGRSIAENMRSAPEREPRSKAVQVAKLTQKFNGDEDARKHIEVFEHVCNSLEEHNELHKCNALSLTLSGKAGDWYRTLRVEERTHYPTLWRLFLKEYIREGVLFGVWHLNSKKPSVKKVSQ